MIDFQNTLPFWFYLYASSILVSHFIIYKGKNGPRRRGDFPSQEHWKQDKENHSQSALFSNVFSGQANDFGQVITDKKKINSVPL